MLNIFKYKDTIQTMWEIDVLSNYYSKLDKLFTLMFFEEVMMNWNIHNLMSQSHLVLQGKLLWSL